MTTVVNRLEMFNPLESGGNYSATSNNVMLVHWPLMVGCYIWYSEERTGGPSPPSPLLAVPNVTAHPSTASVPITVSLYNGPLLCCFDVPFKGLRQILPGSCAFWKFLRSVLTDSWSGSTAMNVLRFGMKRRTNSISCSPVPVPNETHDLTQLKSTLPTRSSNVLRNAQS